MKIKNSKIVDDYFVVISDFHSMREPLEKIKKEYINRYDKIFILGDSTERGRNGDGTGGLQLLMEIKELCENYPGRIHYIPGNHDLLIIQYVNNLKKVKKGQTEYIEELRRYTRGLEINHGTQTIEDINSLMENNEEKFQDLYSWLLHLPIQYVHEFKNQKYALAHAFFDMDLYEKNKDYSFSNTTANDFKRAENIVWFRKKYDEYKSEYVPSSDYIEIVGHTPEMFRLGLDMDLVNANGETVKVYCVDGGYTYDPEKYPIYKFDGKLSIVNLLGDDEIYSNASTIKFVDDMIDVKKLFKKRFK